MSALALGALLLLTTGCSAFAPPTPGLASVAEGGVYVGRSWLGDELLQALRADVRTLLRAGSVPDTDEPIGRRLKLELDTADWSVPGEAEPSEARAAARRKFDALRLELQRVVGRRLFLDELGAQAKYSVGKTGEPIHLHIDQKHEAFEGQAPLFQQRTRRSVAWLLYLSDDDWDEPGCQEPGGRGRGGVLRARPRRDAVGRCGAHEGNLQVGWLERGRGSEPVFLDAWGVPARMRGRTLAELRREMAGVHADEAALWSALFRFQPAYALYCVGADGRREQLSEAHEAPSTADEAEGAEHPKEDEDAGVPSLSEMLPEHLRDGFSSTLCGEHPAQRLLEVSPRGGTLVVFESAVVPHEVTPVVAGERIALFGFFAEERQVPPAWLDPEGEQSDCGPWFHDGRAHTEC